MNDLTQILSRICEFRDARDWKQFHTPKDMAISLMLEAAEVAEIFQWKKDEEISSVSEELGKELADVLYWVVLMAHDFKVDLGEAFRKKMDENERKYPIESAKGSVKKYTNLP